MKKIFLFIIIVITDYLLIKGYTEEINGSFIKFEFHPYDSSRESELPFNPIRPTRPVVNDIECIYNNEVLYVAFDVPQGLATLQLVSQDQTVSCSFTFNTSEEQNIYIGPLDSEHIVLIDTEYGNSYIGYGTVKYP